MHATQEKNLTAKETLPQQKDSEQYTTINSIKKAMRNTVTYTSITRMTTLRQKQVCFWQRHRNLCFYYTCTYVLRPTDEYVNELTPP